MSKPKIEPGEGYRWLEFGETILPTDECYYAGHPAEWLETNDAGSVQIANDVRRRRKLPSAPVTTGGKCPTCKGRTYQLGGALGNPCPDCHETGQKAQPAPKYFVISTPCFPNSFKVTDANDRDNATHNYFATLSDAQAEADRRNGQKAQPESESIVQGLIREGEKRQGIRHVIFPSGAVNLSKAPNMDEHYGVEPGTFEKLRLKIEADEAANLTPMSHRSLTMAGPADNEANRRDKTANLSSDDAEKAWLEYVYSTTHLVARAAENFKPAFLAGRASQSEENAKLRQELESVTKDRDERTKQKSEFFTEFERMRHLLEEAYDHGEQTHRELGAVLGSDDSLLECAKRLVKDRDRILVHFGEISRELDVVKYERNEAKTQIMSDASEMAELKHELENVWKPAGDLAEKYARGFEGQITALRQQLAAKDAACAEMRGALEHALRGQDPDEDWDVIGAKIQSALSTSAGSGWRSPEDCNALAYALRELDALYRRDAVDDPETKRPDWLERGLTIARELGGNQ